MVGYCLFVDVSSDHMCQPKRWRSRPRKRAGGVEIEYISSVIESERDSRLDVRIADDISQSLTQAQ